jgi:radical SAM protein with 4Fe4S-binding SPASM domain
MAMQPEHWPTRLENPVRPARFLSYPRHIGIELTSRCQLKCRHCFNVSGPDEWQELPFDVVQRLLTEIQGWGVSQVRLTGGEPTLHSSFFELLACCHRLGLQVFLNTHGVYASAILHRLESAPVARFIVGIDGLEATHDAIRGTGNFSRALRSIRRLREVEKPVTLALHAAVYNLDELPGIAALAEELQADLKVSPLRPLGRAVTQVAGAIMSPEQNLRLVEAICEARRRYPDLRLFTDFDILDDSRDRLAITDAGQACGAGRSMLAISYTGDVYPCAFFAEAKRRFSLGNVLAGDRLADLWVNAPLLELFRSHGKSLRCRNCEHYGRRCAGGCPAISHFSSGVLDRLDPLCFTHLLNSNRRAGS